MRSYRAHGGDSIADLKDVNVALDGRWHFLITRIQPLVTDHRYRVKSEERLALGKRIYAAQYQGPRGRKSVLRTQDSVQVQYDGESTTDVDVLNSTALTADSFYLFTLGPLALNPATQSFRRLPDVVEKGERYHRIYTLLEPGFGKSARDKLVLWVHAESMRTYRVHITIEGFRTTRGAHVDVTYLDYHSVSGFTFPSEFHERVRGPVAIDAHRWHFTGLDINRGWSERDVQLEAWKALAATPAKSMSSGSPPRGALTMRPLILFDAKTAELGWQVVNDNVMGGKSAGGFRIDADALVFTGSLNTKGGGFASIRSQPKDLQMNGHSSVRLRVLGDGRTYTLLMRERDSDYSYQTQFATEPDQWQEVDLLFSAFEPYRRGTRLQHGLMRPMEIVQLGIMMNDGIDGDFELKVRRIEAR